MLDIWKDELKSELNRPEELQNKQLIKELSEKIEEAEGFQVNLDDYSTIEEEQQDAVDMSDVQEVEEELNEPVLHLSEEDVQGAKLEAFFKNN